MPSRVVDILLPVALDQAYAYRVPDGMELAPGVLVSVPLGARTATGVVWAENPARQRVLTLLADGLARGKGEAAEEAGVSAGVIDGLIDEGTLETLVLPPEPLALPVDPEHLAPEFTPAQRAAA